MTDRTAPTRARPAPPRRRLLRWTIGFAILGLFLAAYALAVISVSGQIGDSVENNLRTLPVLEDHHHGVAPVRP